MMEIFANRIDPDYDNDGIPDIKELEYEVIH